MCLYRVEYVVMVNVISTIGGDGYMFDVKCSRETQGPRSNDTKREGVTALDTNLLYVFRIPDEQLH